MIKRICRDCGVTASTNEDLTKFVKGARYDYGYQQWCIECKKKDAAIRRKEANAFVIEYMGGLSCHKCGLKHENPNFYDLHHTDPKEKDSNIRSMLLSSKHKMEKELSKCILLCPNCHRKEHLLKGYK